MSGGITVRNGLRDGDREMWGRAGASVKELGQAKGKQVAGMGIKAAGETSRDEMECGEQRDISC
jgi:hypothetical protein